MSAPLPTALGSRFQHCVDEGLSGRAAALRLKLRPPRAQGGYGRSGRTVALILHRRDAPASIHRQRTRRPSRHRAFSGSGTARTWALICASCCAVSRRTGSPCGRSRKPSTPAALKRCTQSHKVWRSIPPCRAATCRLPPSSTAAIAISRNDTRLSRSRRANLRRSSALKRVVTANDRPVALFPERQSALNPTMARLKTKSRVMSSACWYHIGIGDLRPPLSDRHSPDWRWIASAGFRSERQVCGPNSHKGGAPMLQLPSRPPSQSVPAATASQSPPCCCPAPCSAGHPWSSSCAGRATSM